MNIVVSVLILLGIVILVAKLYVLNSEKIQFFATGLDSGFRFSEIRTLWRLATVCDLEEPNSLYVSTAALNECISKVIAEEKQKNNINSFKTQQFLDRLYKFRTRITLDKEARKGLDNTRYLDAGQRIRIILPGKGIFVSKIKNNAHELLVILPKQEDKKTKRVLVLKPEEWVGKRISVYLWRKGDACYAFDTIVLASSVFQGEECLVLKHSEQLDRSQKRQSVRCECQIPAQMYMITSAVVDYNVAETEPGFKCLLEDISEDGALIRVGGMGKTNIQIKIQFRLNDTLIIMYGIIRAVEYNKALEQSRLHFECIHIDPSMKNAILTYVYNIIPADQKEKDLAIKLAEDDSNEEGENSKSGEPALKSDIAGLKDEEKEEDAAEPLEIAPEDEVKLRSSFEDEAINKPQSNQK